MEEFTIDLTLRDKDDTRSLTIRKNPLDNTYSLLIPLVKDNPDGYPTDLGLSMSIQSYPEQETKLLEIKDTVLGNYLLGTANTQKYSGIAPLITIADDFDLNYQYFDLNAETKLNLLKQLGKDIDNDLRLKMFSSEKLDANLVSEILHQNPNIGEALRTCLSKVELTTTTPPKFNLQALPLGKYSDFKITHRSSDPNIPVTSIDFDFSDPLSLTWTKFIDKKGYSRTLDLSNPENNSVQIFPELAKFTAVTNELIQNQSLNSPVFNRLLLGDASSNWSSITQTTTKRR